MCSSHGTEQNHLEKWEGGRSQDRVLVCLTVEGGEVEKSGKKIETMQEVTETERNPRECGVTRNREKGTSKGKMYSMNV